ncbi:sigma 54-interacting transcriptional regulator [Siminovitchia fortis]|uniref:AAA family ATPase n=1 Tax=Siminovitchia fortis TaxID=254758 RepID=A0A443IUZ2_9BACI|nr:sigma 54-interacting transcriptional regulator [Siminovitchia fortis]RWR11928.1 AAA family ATPase [Siminovitchia fortis]WHY80812.1 sigma 54-interacting transcriptional regulator [Siminovitchia fortis]
MAFSLTIDKILKEALKNGSKSLHEAMKPSYKTVHINDSVETLIQSLQESEPIVIVNQQQQPEAVLTASDMIQTLYSLYRQLRAFYNTVTQTTDSSVTVIDENELVQTWTEGAEKIFSIKQSEILGRKITDFFDTDKLELLKSLYKGKSITHHQHQPRSDLFVLINSNPVFCDRKIIGAVVSEMDVTSQVMLNEKLFNMSTEVHRLEQEVAKYRKTRDPFSSIKGKSTSLQQTVELARKVCTVKSTVLILGESGVGKEVFAKAIHEASEPEDAPFISVNCGAIPESLFESEMFGYEKGAFSGANQKGKKGKVELARGGTLFLDEIGEMPLDMQVKLLRVLQEQKFYRIGGEKEIDIDFRIIAATNRDLEELVREGKFRDDLFYRLNVVSIQIPPLRERKEDIIELTSHFLQELSIRYERPIQKFPADVIHAMLHYDWPGNIRELRNVVERLVVFSADGLIRKEYLPFVSNASAINPAHQTLEIQKDEEETVLPLQEEMDSYERKVLERALRITDGNKAQCAKQLGITRATLYNRMKRLGLS